MVRDTAEPPAPPQARAVFTDVELAARGKRVLELLKDQVNHPAALLVLGNPPKVLSEDMQYRYRPGSDLFYLTDSEHPHLAALLAPERKTRLYYLDRAQLESGVPRGASFERELALEPGAEGVFKNLEQELVRLRDLGVRVHAAFDAAAWARVAAGPAQPKLGIENHFRALLELCPGATGASPAALCALRQARLRKSEQELARMDRAAAAALRAHALVSQLALGNPAPSEAQLSAHARVCFGELGCNDVSFPNIVCTGHNCFVLHHRPQRRASLAALGPRELPQLLLDLGPSFQGYASDFSTAHWCGERSDPNYAHWARVKVAVRAVLDAMVGACCVGCSVEGLQEVYAKARGGQIQALLLDGPAAGLIGVDPARALPELTPHGVLHWVGIDVHDPSPACMAARKIPFEEGFTLALEPALYFGLEFPDKRYRGVAVRLEETVVVMASGARKLGAQ